MSTIKIMKPVILDCDDYLVPLRPRKDSDMILSPPIKITRFRFRKPLCGASHWGGYVDEQYVKIHDSDLSTLNNTHDQFSFS